MSARRKAITQARFNILNSNLIALEFAAVALILGAVTSSFTIGIGVFFALAVGLMIPWIGPLILFGFTLAWGLLFFSIGFDVGGILGCIVIGLFGTLVSLGFHMSGVTGILESAP